MVLHIISLICNNYIYIKVKSLCLLLYSNRKKTMYCTMYPSLKVMAHLLFVQTPKCVCMCLNALVNVYLEYPMFLTISITFLVNLPV